MDVTIIEQARCRDCKEVCGNIWNGYVYCTWLNCNVWGASEQCDHGKLLNEVF